MEAYRDNRQWMRLFFCHFLLSERCVLGSSRSTSFLRVSTAFTKSKLIELPAATTRVVRRVSASHLDTRRRRVFLFSSSSNDQWYVSVGGSALIMSCSSSDVRVESFPGKGGNLPQFVRNVSSETIYFMNHLSCVCPSVCPSVRPSVTSRSFTKMAKPRIAIRTSYDSPGTLVFRCQKSWRNSNDIIPNGGAK